MNVPPHSCAPDCPAFGKDHVMAYGCDNSGSYWLDCSCGEQALFVTWQGLAGWRDEHGRT